MKVNERRTVVGGWLATVCPPTVERDRRACPLRYERTASVALTLQCDVFIGARRADVQVSGRVQASSLCRRFHRVCSLAVRHTRLRWNILCRRNY